MIVSDDVYVWCVCTGLYGVCTGLYAVYVCTGLYSVYVCTGLYGVYVLDCIVCMYWTVWCVCMYSTVWCVDICRDLQRREAGGSGDRVPQHGRGGRHPVRHQARGSCSDRGGY